MAFYRWREPPGEIPDDVGFRVVIECPVEPNNLPDTIGESAAAKSRSSLRTMAEGLDHETTVESLLAPLGDAAVAVYHVGLAQSRSRRPASARPPEVWAIVVGIDNYSNAAIPDGKTRSRNASGSDRRSSGRAGTTGTSSF